ncbi:MAG: YbaN family protein [Bacteroidales bacterium]
MSKKLLKILLLTLGTISLVLGIIGMFLPVLPTTPFLLLTAFLFMHGSPEWHDRLLANKWTGPVLEDYKVHKSIRLKKKIVILALLWSTMLLNIFCFVDNLWIDLLLLAISIGVTTHILMIKTRR